MRAIAFSLVLTAALSTGALAAIPAPACDVPPAATLDRTDVGHGALIGDVPIVADMLSGLKSQPPAAPAKVAPAPQLASQSDADQVVCHFTEIVGSHIKSMLCLTKRRWDQMHHDGRRFMGEED